MQLLKNMNQLHFLYSLLFMDAKNIFAHMIYFFISLLFVLFIVIVIYSIYAKRRCNNKKRWEDGMTDLLNEAIFSDDENELVIIDATTKKLLTKAHYRQCLIDEIIKARKALSGSACGALKNLYEQLDLDEDSFNKISHLGWQKKAKGIQELSSLEQGKYVKDIFRLTVHENETVRNEAQCGLVSYFGFLGLRFLNVTIHPISEWQQIQLLNKLNAVKVPNPAMLTRWLDSEMESVVIFSLKLASFYNNFEVYDAVLKCLSHDSIKVKLQVLEYLKKIQGDDTSEMIINEYANDDKIFRLAVIDTLKYVGDIKEVPFLLLQLQDKDNDIKAAAAKTLMVLHPSDNVFLQTDSYAEISPLNRIFKQVKNELAA